MPWLLKEALEIRKEEQGWRSAHAFYGASRHQLESHQGTFVNFSSNDYLGLASSEILKDAFAEGIKRSGVGSGASHLVTGHHEDHQALERSLAKWLQREDALVFSTGYMANLAVIATFLGKNDFAFEDRWNHASLIDGVSLSQAHRVRYKHGDVLHLDARLKQKQPIIQATQARALVVTDGVFSMDGDLAPLTDMVSRLHNIPEARLMVDDAHGIGVLGNEGRGTLDYLGVSQGDVPILVGTLGKAVGTSGAFVAGPKEWIETLRQFARPFLYTTALPPALAFTTIKAIELIKEGHLQKILQRNIAHFKARAQAHHWPLLPSDTPIQPLVLEDSSSALALSEYLKEHGLWVTAIRPPTVAKGTSRLRITLTAMHDEAVIDQLVDKTTDWLKQHKPSAFKNP